MSSVLDVHVLFCVQVDRLILYLGERGVGGGGGAGLIHVCGNLLFMYGSLQSKMEYIQKLSNFNFQWTKTLYQNNYLFI